MTGSGASSAGGGVLMIRCRSRSDTAVTVRLEAPRLVPLGPEMAVTMHLLPLRTIN